MGSVPTTREKRKRGQKQSRKKKIDATPQPVLDVVICKFKLLVLWWARQDSNL